MTYVDQKFTNVEFLHPLVQIMCQRKPEERPDAEVALRRWRRIRGSVGLLQRGGRLRGLGESRADAIVFDVIGFLKLGILLSRRFLVWTVRWLAAFQLCL